MTPEGQTHLSKVIHARHSERGSFAPKQAPSENELQEILGAARWVPTAHNMQNFEVIVVDDRRRWRRSATCAAEFIRENYA
jgi:nitroreductase